MSEVTLGQVPKGGKIDNRPWEELQKPGGTPVLEPVTRDGRIIVEPTGPSIPNTGTSSGTPRGRR